MKTLPGWFVPVTLCGLFCCASPAHAEPIGLQWPQPGGPGTPVFITYSYSNLLDRSFFLLSQSEIRAATEEALGIWARYAPLHFIEVPDSGPAPSDASYAPDGSPQIRLGHLSMSELARGFYPSDFDGLGGDVHFDVGIPWSVGEGHWNFLEAITHELGHALGLGHELGQPAIMNPSYPQRRFFGLGSVFLFPADIDHIRAIYGTGTGSVQHLSPVPEPATVALFATGVAVVLRARRRRSRD